MCFPAQFYWQQSSYSWGDLSTCDMGSLPPTNVHRSANSAYEMRNIIAEWCCAEGAISWQNAQINIGRT